MEMYLGKPWLMGAIKSLCCNWWKNMHQIDAYPEVDRITYCYNFIRIDLSRLILTRNSLKTFVEGMFVTGTLNIGN